MDPQGVFLLSGGLWRVPVAPWIALTKMQGVLREVAAPKATYVLMQETLPHRSAGSGSSLGATCRGGRGW